MSQPLLTVTDLAVSFRMPHGDVDAVQGVSFSLQPGQALGVVGESGSGKSVTCRTLIRLLPPTAEIRSGTVLLRGRNLLDLSPAELRKVRGRELAMIFQTPSTFLDPLMPVGRQIEEGLKLHRGLRGRAARVEAMNLLDRVRIADPKRRINSYPHELSGGMKQRVMIAAALACGPSVLLADEPTTALDVTVQAEILQLLNELRREAGLSLILVSHDLAVVASVCDEIIVMKDGRVVEAGPTRAIMRQPQAAYTQELLASHPGLELDGDGAEAASTRAPVAGGLAAGRAGDPRAGVAAPVAPLLRVEDLSVTFGQARNLLDRLAVWRPPPVDAVRGASFEVDVGETVGIVGESGSGKSTIGRAVVQLVSPTGGRVLFRGHDTKRLDRQGRAAFRRAVQIVFQDPYASLNPRLTVRQALGEPLRWHHICPPERVDERIGELMESVGLHSRLLDRRPDELSGGQCQRVAIARALSVGPELLVADEVTSSLDVTIQAQILSLLERLREERALSILFISHDLGVVKRLCHRVLVMRGGRLLEEGPTTRVLRAPQHAYTKALLAAVPRIDPAKV